jgi:D-alanine-D-alanine ligase-like ATP-grasp enzyme
MSSPQSIDILQKILGPKGYNFEQVLLGRAKTSFTRITSPSGSMLMISTNNPLFPFASSTARLIYKDKLKSYDLAQQLGIQTPKMVSIQRDSLRDEMANLREFLMTEKRVIVKPSNGAGSHGLTLDISSIEQFEVALETVFMDSPTALIQAQFIGEEIRFATIDGTVRSALLRKKPVVIGDGVKTVRELIRQENEDRLRIRKSLVDYPQLDSLLVPEELLNSETVPATGDAVELNKSTMIKGGASIYNILDDVHPGYLELVEKMASQFGPGFLVVDFMMSDYMQMPTQGNYIYLETNVNPALSLFYSCRDGKQSDIAERYIAPMIEKSMISSI